MDEIDRRPGHQIKRLCGNDYLDFPGIEDMVSRFDGLRDFDIVGPTGTTSAMDAEFQADSAVASHEFANPLCGARSQSNCFFLLHGFCWSRHVQYYCV